MGNENRYLGEDKISKLLLKFSIPCVMGLLISALYNIVDQIFIGNSELGFYGNAATGVSFPILCIWEEMIKISLNCLLVSTEDVVLVGWRMKF